ncbi:MAG: Ig-like domain-containing protein [Eubacterium sp.]|nr:Ig-like domain-containing protein [Eubacterium sp.]
MTNINKHVRLIVAAAAILIVIAMLPLFAAKAHATTYQVDEIRASFTRTDGTAIEELMDGEHPIPVVIENVAPSIATVKVHATSSSGWVHDLGDSIVPPQPRYIALKQADTFEKGQEYFLNVDVRIPKTVGDDSYVFGLEPVLKDSDEIYYRRGSIYDGGDYWELSFAVLLMKATGTPIWIQGVQVTRENCTDVLGAKDSGSTVTYDYTTDTITLNNAKLTYGPDAYARPYNGVVSAVFTGLPINIELKGNSVITPKGTAQTGDYVTGIYGEDTLNIKGTGSLKITADGADCKTTEDVTTGINALNDVTISGGNLNIYSTGFTTFGISSDCGNVNITGTAKVQAASTALTESAGIGCEKLILKDNAVLVAQGANAAFRITKLDTSLHKKGTVMVSTNFYGAGAVKWDGKEQIGFDANKYVDSIYKYVAIPEVGGFVEEAITNAASDLDVDSDTYSLLKPKAAKVKNTSIKLKWSKAKGASKYIVYGNLYGNKYKFVKIKSTGSKSCTVKKIAGKKLKKGKYYKFLIIALGSGNKAVASSPILYVATAGSKKAGNYAKITTKAKKNKVTVKRGKKFKLAAAAKAPAKQKVKKIVDIRYESTKPAIATVDARGIIKGIKKGKCYVYAFAQNGLAVKIKVTVK